MHILKTYLLNCSFHGVPFVVDKRFHWTERLFWFVMVVLSWLDSVYLMYFSYEQFRTSGISFTVDTSYLNWKSKFPALVFCEKGNQKHHEYMALLFGAQRNFYLDAVLKDIVYFEGGFSGVSLQCGQDGFYCPFPTSNFTEYTEKVRSSCGEIFGFCSVNDKEFDCCDQLMPIDTLFGKCFALNSVASEVQPKHPLQLNVSHKHGHDVMTVTIEVLNSDLKVLILSRNAVPSYIGDNNIVMDGVVSAKHEKDQIITYMSIQEILNEKDVRYTSVERRNCKFPDENNFRSSNKLYSYSTCIVDCLLEIQMARCNCNHHLMPSVKSENMCDIKGLICLSLAFDDMMQDTFKCSNCYSSCAFTEIRILGTESAQNYDDFNNNQSTTQIQFVLYAPTVRYVRSVVNGNLDLIVSLGGTAGLCVGASVLTIVEIIYYLFVRPYDDYQIERYKRKNKIMVKKRKVTKPPYPFRL